MTTERARSTRRIGLGNAGLALSAAAVVVVACGAEPKVDPVAPLPPDAPVSTALPEAGAATPAAVPAVEVDGGGAAKSDKQAACDALVDDANVTLDAERIAVDKVCKKDADCMPIKGRACGFVCVTGAIPKAEEKEWNESVQKVKDGACKKWTESDCVSLKTKAPPTCQERKVACEKGHCVLKDK